MPYFPRFFRIAATRARPRAIPKIASIDMKPGVTPVFASIPTPYHTPRRRQNVPLNQ